jgi:putative spermidine/putrescine transport system ATP-binding protein
LDARVTAVEGGVVTLDCRGVTLRRAGGLTSQLGETLLLALRPNKIMLLAPGQEAPNRVTGRITTALYAGTVMQLVVETPIAAALEVTVPIRGSEAQPTEGDVVTLGWGLDATVAVASDEDA